jgi:hypothetical protein
LAIVSTAGARKVAIARRLSRRPILTITFTQDEPGDPWLPRALRRAIAHATGVEPTPAAKLADDVLQESTERMAIVEKLAGHLADWDCADCNGEGLDWEGQEWALCACVLRKIGDL